MENDDSSSIRATQYDDEFTVHNYTSGSFSAGAGSAELLSSAQRLINQVSTRHKKGEWRTVKEQGKLVWVPGKLYAYNHPLPEIHVEERAAGDELKEWGTPAAKDEIWSMCDLEEFESTNFSRIGNAFRHSTEKTRASWKRPRSEEAEQPMAVNSSAAKRRRTDEGPLHGAIPRPHTFLTSLPYESSQPTTLKAYKRTVPIIIPPYTSPLPEPSKWDRRAWIIPVRGANPWEGATGAAVLDDREGFGSGNDLHFPNIPSRAAESVKEILKPIPPTPQTLEPVLWTRESLRSFWEYLKVLRADGKLGSLGMTFHTVPRYKDGSAPSATAQGQGWMVDTSSQKASAPTTQPEIDKVVEMKGSAGLSSVDYIKVYHDAVQSMFLRTAIDIWQYEVRGDKGQSVERIRVLKGAKLVLVDHLNEGVMIS